MLVSERLGFGRIVCARLSACAMWPAFWLPLLLFGVTAADAASRREGGVDPRQQQLIAQLTAERTQLRRERDQLSEQLGATQQSVTALEARVAAATRELKEKDAALQRVAAEQEQLQTVNGRYRERLEEFVVRYRELTDLLKAMEVERNTLAEMATAYDERVLVCERNNEGLHRIATEVIERYEDKGLFAVLRQREPVTQLARVEIENMLDEYQRLADDMRLRYEVALELDNTDESREQVQ